MTEISGRERPSSGAIRAILALSILVLAASCAGQLPSSWYPEGSASVASFYESTALDMRSFVVTLKITNGGLSKITTSTLSVSVKTDKRTYIKTIVSDTGILPGGSVYATVAIDYAEATEATSLADIAVVEQFYE